MPDRTIVRLSADLIMRAKRKSVAERPTVEKTSRIPLPVSTAKGGLMQGIDLHNSIALQELDDIDHMRRNA